jgi:hypothetical protein
MLIFFNGKAIGCPYRNLQATISDGYIFPYFKGLLITRCKILKA